MDEDRKSNEKERKENERSGEESHTKEGTAGDEEATHVKEDDVEEEHIGKSENGENQGRRHLEQKENKTDDQTTEGAEENDDDEGVKNKDEKDDETERVETCATEEGTGYRRDKDGKEVKDEKVCKDVNEIKNESQKSGKVVKVACNKAQEIEVQEMINRNIEDLKMSSVETVLSEGGNVQLKTGDRATSVPKQQLVTNKHKHTDIKPASGGVTCGQANHQGAPSEELLSKEQDKKMKQAVTSVVAEAGGTGVHRKTDETVQIDGTEHVNKNHRLCDDIHEEVKKKEMVTEVKKEELCTGNKDMKKDSKIEDRTISTDKNLVQVITVVQGCENVLLESKECNQTIHNNEKEPEKLSAMDKGEGQMEMRNVDQEEKSKNEEAQEMHSCRGTIQTSAQNKMATGEHEEKTSDKVENETDNKVTKENNEEASSCKKEGSEEYGNVGQQKEEIGDRGQSDASAVVKDSADSSTQVSVDEVGWGKQKKQICTPEERGMKSSEECEGKSGETLKSTVILPAIVSHEKDKLHDNHNITKGTTTAGRPVCTAFQGTIPKRAKCEESIRRSEIMQPGHNEGSNKVEADDSASTEAAVNNQLKQSEGKSEQCLHLIQQRQTQEQTLKQQHPQNQEEQTETEQRKQQQQKSASQQNEKHEEKGRQGEQNKRKQVQEIRQRQKQKIQDEQQEVQLQKQGKQRGHKDEDQIGKEKQSNEEQQKYEQVQQAQQERTNKRQPELQQHQQEQPKQHWKPKEQQQERAGQYKQKQLMMTQQEDEEKPKQQRKAQEPGNQERQQGSEEGESDGAEGCGGAQGRSCPIYFGVRSYLHQFYDSTPVKNSQLYEDYAEEDDFEYAVDPIKSRGCRKCCRGFWFRVGLWGGINLMLVGVITLLVGYLTPQREMIVGHQDNLEILDRTAITFNRRLELCRLAGLAVFCCGGVVLLFTLLLSTFLHIGGHNNNNSYCCAENAYYGYVTTSFVEPFIAGQMQGSNALAAASIKVPITEEIKSVQPTLWPDISTVKDGTLVPHMP